MFSGSGTNLKMLDYFAAGLPVISTAAGARGLNLGADDCVVCPAEEFVQHIQALLSNASLREAMARSARQLAVERYDWALIAQQAAGALHTLLGER